MDFFPTCRIAAVVALLSSAATAGAQSKRPMTIMDIMDLKNVGGVSLSPDGSKVAYAVNGWEHPSARPSADSTKPDTAKGDKQRCSHSASGRGYCDSIRRR